MYQKIDLMQQPVGQEPPQQFSGPEIIDTGYEVVSQPFSAEKPTPSKHQGSMPTNGQRLPEEMCLFEKLNQASDLPVI